MQVAPPSVSIGTIASCDFVIIAKWEFDILKQDRQNFKDKEAAAARAVQATSEDETLELLALKAQLESDLAEEAFNASFAALADSGGMDSDDSINFDILKCTEYDECKCVEVKCGVLW
jgi:hypothetical protein